MTEQPAGGSGISGVSGERGDVDVAPPRRFSRGTMVALIAAAAVVLLLVGATLGLALISCCQSTATIGISMMAIPSRNSG